MSSLRAAAAAGARWIAMGAAISGFAQLIQFTLLARWLAPDDFGLMAMALVIVGLAQTFADGGVSAALIQRASVTPEQRSSLYWLGVGIGIVFFLTLVALAPAVEAMYREPRIRLPLIWIALSFLIVPLGQQFQLLLEKQLAFRTVATIEVTGALVGAGTAIGLAAYEPTVWALVAGYLANTTIRTLLLLLLGWRRWPPALHFRYADLTGFVGFGLYQMGERGLNYANQRLDQLLIGTIAGARALGYYNFAYFLAMQVNQRINPILTRVAFPLLSKVQHADAKLRRGYMTVRRLLAIANVPLLLGLGGVAPQLVPLVFEPKWLPAVPALQILVFVAVLRSIGNPIGSLLLAKGRADLGFRWNLGLFLVHVPGLCVGALLGGAIGIAWSLLILHALYAAAEYAILVRPLLGTCLREYLSSVAPALWIGVVMMLAVVAIPTLVSADRWPLLGLQVVSGAAIYFALHSLFNRRQARALLSELTRC